MNRPSMDEVWLGVALQLARRGTCYKARVGCVLTNSRGYVLSTGWNGPEEGAPHCNEEFPHVSLNAKTATEQVSLMMSRGKPARREEGAHYVVCADACPGALAPRGADLCEAVHAEQNALTQCANAERIHTAYCSLSPCLRCAKQLLNTGVQRVVYAKRYAAEPQAYDLLTRPTKRRPSGVEMIHLPMEASPHGNEG